MSTTTYQRTMRLAHQRGTAPSHDHAWQHLDPDHDDRLLFGRYRCTLCRVVWEL